MFDFLCDGINQCDFEIKYKNKCEKRHNDISVLDKCLQIETDYSTTCFSSHEGVFDQPFPPEDPSILYGILSSRDNSNKPFCSALLINHGTIATIDHCSTRESQIRSDTLFTRKNIAFEVFFQEQGSEDKIINVEVDQTAFKIDPLLIGSPMLFARTELYAFNSIAFSRFNMMELNGRRNERGFILADRSPLCTIVKINKRTGKLVHTCQSTLGSSGGVLYQIHEPNGRRMRKAVGLNEGAESRGQVHSNIGYQLNSSNYTTKDND